MDIITSILRLPVLWKLSQIIFGCDAEKRRIYRSVFNGTGRLLDFGCADGVLFPAFRDFEYYGLDIDGRLIERARRKFSRSVNAHFVGADLLDRPFPAGYFDFVLFGCTGHHLTDKQLFPIMGELARVLREGGRLHLFDTIRDPGRESRLLKFLIGIDQGKYMRSEKIYNGMLNGFSNMLRPVESRSFQLTGTFMPQPRWYYAEFVKTA